MKRKSKMTAVLLCMTLAFNSAFITACSKDEKKDEPKNNESTPAATNTPAEEQKDPESTPTVSPDDKNDDKGQVVVGTDLKYDGYTEVWKDEFEGTELNRDDWNVELHNPGWVNEELQAYVDSKDNIYVKDGYLYLNPVETDWGASGKTYTSGRVNTQGKHDLKYGLIEARVKFPEGKGYLPAFWMMPTNENLYGQWPKCGEIDIAEVMGQGPNTLYGTIHYGEPHGQKQGIYELESGPSFTDDFHTFAIEWEPGVIIWYVDGFRYYQTRDWFTAVVGGGEITFPAPFDQPFYVILNLAIGGSWVGYPDETTSFENNPYIIDYVRMYQKDASYYEEKEAKCKKSEKPIEYREADENGNFVVNGDFSQAFGANNDWTLHLESDGKGSEAVIQDNGELLITQAAKGSVLYSVQLKQEKIPILKGVEYTLSFDAKADENRSIVVDVEGPDKNWERYLKDTTVDITTEMKTYTYTFTMEKDSDANSCVEFNLGNLDSTASVYLDNISIKATGGKVIGDDVKNVRADGNYVYNGAFQEGTGRLGFWEFDEADADKISVTNIDNDRRLKVVAPEGTSEASPVVIRQTALPMIAGSYMLTYKAYKEDAAAGDKSLIITVGKAAEQPELTTDKDQSYSKRFAFADGDPAEIELKFTAPGTYYVDDIFVAEDAMVKNGSFNAGMSGFVQYSYNTAKSEYTVDSLSEDNAFAITINDTGTEDWHVQLYQDGVELVQGKCYRFTFKAKSSKDRTIKAVLQHNGSSDNNWDPYFDHIFAELTSEYKTFTADFEMLADSDPVARLDFALGNVGGQIKEGHSIFIDDITLVEIDKSEANLPAPAEG